MPASRPFLALLCTLSVLSLAATPAHAQDDAQNSTDWKKGKWGHLAQYVGTYNYDAVLSDPQVSEKIDAAVGSAKKSLLENLKVRSPIGFERDCLVLTGNAEGGGYADRAYVNVCLFAGQINIVNTSEKSIDLYTSTKTYIYLPLSLRQWIYVAQNPEAFDAQPKGVQFHSMPE